MKMTQVVLGEKRKAIARHKQNRRQRTRFN